MRCSAMPAAAPHTTAPLAPRPCGIERSADRAAGDPRSPPVGPAGHRVGGAWRPVLSGGDHGGLPADTPPAARSGRGATLAPSVTPAEAPRTKPMRAAVPAEGMATHYVLPAGGHTLLWQRDERRDSYLPGGELAAFTPVQALHVVPQHGLMEIRLADGGSGFVDADTAGARRPGCCAPNLLQLQRRPIAGQPARCSPATGRVRPACGSTTREVSPSSSNCVKSRVWPCSASTWHLAGPPR